MMKSDEIADLIVVGGGSAGMAAAIRAAQLGLKVIVFDHAGIDYDKPCGEGLMPPGVEALSGLGVVLPEAFPFSGIAYVSKQGQRATATFRSHVRAIGVRRRVLRRAMWERARVLGVQIIEKRVENVTEERDDVLVEGARGRWLCLASGSRDPVLRKLGLQDPTDRSRRARRVGLRRHARIAPWSDCVEVHWSADCELYVTPVSEDVVNIAILSWRAISFDDALKLFPELEKRLRDVVWDDSVAGVSPLAHRSSRLQQRRVFVAGDAAGFIDAMTGEGNTLALQSGIAVAECVVRESAARYRWRWWRIFWRYWLLTNVSLMLSRNPVMREIAVKCVMRFPKILQIGLRFLSIEKSTHIQGASY